MVCLLCLRNEGIHFSYESPNDLDILSGLFELPQKFSQTLEGNKCCSLCRVKLEFVEVIKKEIAVLSDKLKCFVEEVKGIFLSSFNGNDEAIESNETFELAIQARRKLLKELHLADRLKKFKQTSLSLQKDSEVSEIEIKSTSQPDDPSDNSQISLSNHLQVKSIFSCIEIEYDEESPNLENFHAGESQVSQDKSNARNAFTSAANQHYSQSEIESSSVDLSIPDKSKLTKQSKSKITRVDLGENSNVRQEKSSISTLYPKNSQLPLNHPHRHQPTTIKLNSKGQKIRMSFCFICKPRVEFQRPEEYEEHLRNVHPTRPYSKCPKCFRVLMENKAGKGTKTRLNYHMRTVHTQIRPFKCHHCEAAFKSNDNLKKHCEIHLNRKIYNCERCNSRHLGLRNFQFHLKMHK